MIAGPSSKIITELIEVGLIPKNCSHFDLHMGVSEVVTATATFYVTEEQLTKLDKVYAENKEEGSTLAREMILTDDGERYVRVLG